MKSFAQVALPIPKRNLFTYAVPPELADACQPGALALVPVGRGRRVGVIWTVTDQPAWSGALRPIADILGGGPLLDDSLRELLDWIARYYMRPIGSVTAVALPGQLGFDRQRRAVWRGADPETTPPALRPLAEAIAARAAGLTEGTLAKKFGRAGLERRLKQLAGRGLITLEESWRARGGADGAGAEASSADALAPAALASASPAHDSPISDSPSLDLPVADSPSPDCLSSASPSSTPVARPGPRLNAAQQVCVDALDRALEAGGFAPFLLEGVTGSGKTEVYFKAVAKCLELGRQALLLVPEIALTPQLIDRFRARFPRVGLAVFHSGLTDRQRLAHWRQARQGEARVAIGARSALFAAFDRLGLLVVDEEHDGSYKQEGGVPYNARDMAVVRSRQAGAVVVLGSATPSLETLGNATRGRYGHLRLTERATGAPLPQVRMIDLREQSIRETMPGGALISGPLRDALAETLAAGRQALLFLNRRGYAPSLLCRRCGAVIACDNCSVALTLHKSRGRLVCHYCDHVKPVADLCAECGQLSMGHFGFGTEQLEEEIKARFPAARIARLDRDVVSGGVDLDKTLADFRDGHIDILAGTQMVAKGHHFANLALVGVVLAETSLWQPDFRAAERTFQLVTQVAGRAGREEVPGRVLVQTYDPTHYALTAAAGHDVGRFVAQERGFRQEAGYPPFQRLALLRYSTPVLKEGEGFAGALRAALPQSPGARILGPAIAPLARLRGRYRWQALIKESEPGRLHAVAGAVLRLAEGLAAGTRIRLELDVDPYAFL